jgi:hypothetical protein
MSRLDSPVSRPQSQMAPSRPRTSFGERSRYEMIVAGSTSPKIAAIAAPEPQCTRWETPLPADQAVLSGLPSLPKTDYIYGPSLPPPSPKLTMARTGLSPPPISLQVVAQSPISSLAETRARAALEQVSSPAEKPMSASRLRLRSPLAGDYADS